MIVVLQRVKSATVRVRKNIIGEIKQGYLIFLGIENGDEEQDAILLSDKIAKLRCFSDGKKPMNLSIHDVNLSILVVSQFTLCANFKSGRRPSFSNAADPQIAEKLYLQFCKLLSKKNINIQTGQFAADMEVTLVNDGPVTFKMDSKTNFKT